MSSPPIVDFAPTDAARFGPKLVALTSLARLGVPVPPFFAIDVETTTLARQSGELPIAAKQAIMEAMAELEARAERRFGDPEKPLLVSVRPSTAVRMPAILAKVLDVGLNQLTFPGLTVGGRSRRFALDCRLHFLRTYGEALMPRPHAAQTSLFSAATAEARRRFGATTTGELDTPVLEALVDTYHDIYRTADVALPPEDPWDQLFAAIRAVSRSWTSTEAGAYRSAQNIPEQPGPALAITAMVFGNVDARSASGLALSRHPSTGARGPSGEHLPTAQGDELGAGHGQPRPLSIADASTEAERALSLEARLPEAYAALAREAERVEKLLGAPAEIEFAIEEGRAYVLHAQPAPLANRARVRATVDLAAEGVITEAAAVRAVRPADLTAILRPAHDAPTEGVALFAKGLPASPGAATGKLTLSTVDAIDRAGRGEPVILVVADTAPTDGAAVRASKGLVTTRGGTTSDAAITARALGKPCIVSARELVIDGARGTVSARGQVARDGETITVDGTRGELLLGRRATLAPPSLGEATRLLGWADATRAIDVRAIVETPDEVAEAYAAGAHGFLAHRMGRWMRSELTEVVRAASGRSITLRLPTSADPDMDAVRMEAVIEASRGQDVRLEILVDGLAWNLHPRLLKLRSRLADAKLAGSRVGVWIDTEVDLRSLVGPASALAAVDVVVVELDAMARRSSLPAPRATSSIAPPGIGMSDEGPRGKPEPPSPAARILPLVEAARALGAKAPTIGVITALGASDEPDLSPWVQAKVAFLGVMTRDVPLMRLAAARVV